MKVCIIGDGLVSLALANVLIRKNLPVDIVFDGNLKKYDKSRTIGISKSNIDYFFLILKCLQIYLFGLGR